MTRFGLMSVCVPMIGPYHATAARRFGLCAAYSQVMRPPAQNPVVPMRLASPLLAPAHFTAPSRSVSTVASGALETIDITSVVLERSPMRA